MAPVATIRALPMRYRKNIEERARRERISRDPTTATFRRRNTGSRTTSTVSRRPAKKSLPEALAKRIEEDPLFSITTLNGEHWIDPYTGQSVPAPEGWATAARKHFLEHDAWIDRQPLSRQRIMELRWRYDLLRLLPFESRLRIFVSDGGPWVNPFTGELDASVTKEEGRITTRTVRAMAKSLSLSGAAENGNLLEKDDLKSRASAQAAAEARAQNPERSVSDPGFNEDIERASAVQKNMLGNLPDIPGFSLAVHFAPQSGVSGDFYEAMTLEDGRILLLLGDVSGHGMQAALVVATAVKTLRMLARSSSDLVELLSQLNDELKPDLLPGQFLTAFAGILDPEEHSLTCILAGHHPLLLANLDSPTPLRKVGKPGMAIGLVAGDRFRQSLRPETLKLEQGDTLMQYTDGIEEAKNADGEEFGPGRVFGHFLSSIDGNLQVMVDSMAETVNTFAAGEVGDDVTVMALKVDEPIDLELEN